MMKRTITILILFTFSGLIYSKESAPYVWWGHGNLSMGIEACLQRSHLALESSGFNLNPINKQHNFLYAYKGSIRVGIQCLKRDDGTFFYLNAAGNDNKLLEKVRNELVAKIK